MCYVTNVSRSLVIEISSMVSESNEIKVFGENYAWFELDVEDFTNQENSSEDSSDPEGEDFVAAEPENTDHSILPC